MFLRYILYLFLFISLLAPSSLLYSRMPGWTFFKDREGNEYYYDRAFKIVITDAPDFNFSPVSEAGIEYYYNSAMEYVKKGDVARGLFFYKSILALESKNNRLKKFQIKAAQQVRSISTRHGTRMEGYDNRSTLLILKNRDIYRIINEKLFYNLELPHRPWIIREGWKYSHKGYGLKFGINRDETSKKACDFITGVESRILPYPVYTAEEGEKIWEKEVGPDAFLRTLLYESRDTRVYTYRYPGDSPFKGYEGIFINRNMVHLVRVMFHYKMEPFVDKEVREIMKSFTLVK